MYNVYNTAVLFHFIPMLICRLSLQQIISTRCKVSELCLAQAEFYSIKFFNIINDIQSLNSSQNLTIRKYSLYQNSPFAQIKTKEKKNLKKNTIEKHRQILTCIPFVFSIEKKTDIEPVHLSLIKLQLNSLTQDQWIEFIGFCALIPLTIFYL